MYRGEISMLQKNLKITVFAGKRFAAIAFLSTAMLFSGCSTPEPQKQEIPTQPQKPQTNNQYNQQPNQTSNESNDDDKDDDKDEDDSKDDKD
jgi:outer membrane PBP1 activator LpoA protein